MSRRSRRIQLQHHVEDDDQDDSDEEEEMDEGNDNGDEEGDDDGDDNDEDESEDDEDDDGDEDQDGEDGDGDDDGVDSESSRRRARGKTKAQSAEETKKPVARTSKAKNKVISGVVLTLDEMVHNSILFLLLQHHKKLQIKRADIVKNAMNGQLKSFPEVMAKIEQILDERFGIQLIGVEESKGRMSGFSSYILVSKYPMTATECASNRTPEAETKRAALYLILAVIFMLGRSIEEDLIWKIFSDLHINTLICKKKDDLRRFLKQEYVSPLYLNAEEVKETEQIFCRYSWGLRADKEVSKYSMLKFVCKQFPEKKPYDFTAQYSIVLEKERDVVEADRAEMENCNGENEEMEDGSVPEQIVNFEGGRVASVEYRGGDGRSEQNESQMEVDDAAVANVENIAPNQAEGNGETMEDDENGSESGSESGSGSASGSDEAADGSDGNSDSGSSESGSESESEE